MDINEIEKILLENAGIKSCPICGTPFDPHHSRQKTCGDPNCKREYHNQYTKEYNRKRRRDNPEVCRRYNADKMRRYRAKQKALERRDSQLKDLADHWSKQIESERKVAEYGHEYGKRSAEKILATIPKIDVNLGGKHDTVHTKDDSERS